MMLTTNENGSNFCNIQVIMREYDLTICKFHRKSKFGRNIEQETLIAYRISEPICKYNHRPKKVQRF